LSQQKKRKTCDLKNHVNIVNPRESFKIPITDENWWGRHAHKHEHGKKRKATNLWQLIKHEINNGTHVL
jgi:hypothetical protein